MEMQGTLPLHANAQNEMKWKDSLFSLIRISHSPASSAERSARGIPLQPRQRNKMQGGFALFRRVRKIECLSIGRLFNLMLRSEFQFQLSTVGGLEREFHF